MMLSVKFQVSWCDLRSIGNYDSHSRIRLYICPEDNFLSRIALNSSLKVPCFIIFFTDRIVRWRMMKLIISITFLIVILFNSSKIRIFDYEPVVLIFFGICLIGIAKIGRSQIKNKTYKLNWQAFKLLVGNSLFKKQTKNKIS